ncbi:MAG: tetratricopeptide repeat protein [Balneolaceae bacterium]
MKRSLLLLAIFWIPLFTLQAQTPVLVYDDSFREAARGAIDSLYNRSPAEAQLLLSEWREELPEHPIWTLWDAMEFWWVVLVDLEDETYDEQLFERMDDAVRAAEELLEGEPNHPDAWVIQAVAQGYAARQHANRERWIVSIRTARRALQAHQRLKEIAPDLPDNDLAEGLILYYADYLPEAYTLVRAVSWLLPDGDRVKGLELLERASEDAIFARPEALYFLGNIRLNYENEYSRATEHLQLLTDRYPDNSFYQRLYVRSLFEQNQDRRALERIESLLYRWDESGLANYDLLVEELMHWRGRILVRFLRYEEAYEAFESSYMAGLRLPNQASRRFLALSAYYAGVTAERLQNRDTAAFYFRRVQSLDTDRELRRRASERMSDL